MAGVFYVYAHAIMPGLRRVDDRTFVASFHDVAAVRARFDEDRWTRFNVARAVASTLALGCLAWALVEFGRM